MRHVPRFWNEKSSRLHRRQRSLAVEALEGRAVLSVCGVTCELINGQLNVQGTAAADAIAVRYDANTALVAVLGGNDELIGQYPLTEVQRLNVNGLAAGDKFAVDSRLALPISYNAEGESAASSSAAHVHQHTAIASDSGSSLTLTAANPLAVNTSAASPITSASAVAAVSTSSLAATLLASSLTSTDHTSHEQSLGSVDSDSHSSHSALWVSAMPATAGGLSSLSHNHDTTYSTITASAGAMLPGALAIGASQSAAYDSDAELSGHNRHAGVDSKSESEGKLVPKRCTVTVTGKQVVTSADGKRQCDCDKIKLAAEEIAKQLAPKETGLRADLLAAVLAECVPCQRGLLPSLPGEEETCSVLPVAAAGLPLPGLEAVEMKACPAAKAKRLAVSSADQASALPWLSDVQLAGWTLVAASVALLPTLCEKREEEEQAVENGYANNVDWLFGRLNVELLVR